MHMRSVLPMGEHGEPSSDPRCRQRRWPWPWACSGRQIDGSDRSMVQTDRRFRRVGCFDDMPGPAPAFHTVHLHSRTDKSHMAVVWVLWLGHASAFRDYLIFVLALGVSWYGVALNVDSWRRDRTVLTRVPLRLAAALLLIAMGAFWGLTMASEVRDALFPYWHW